MEKERLRTILVIGDNPDELMKKYDGNLEVEPYIKYRYSDAEKIKNNGIKLLKELLDADIDFTEFQIDLLKNRIQTLEQLTPFEYYSTVTNGLEMDNEGNALTTENPNGKWSHYNKGGNFSYPFVKVDGETTYQCNADEIDWSKIHMYDKSIQYFDAVWRMVKDHEDPKDDFEKHILEQWGERVNYLNNFETKEQLIRHNCSFWTYAVLNENGWVSIDSYNDEEWISNYFDRFIKPLNGNELLTIFEFNNI